MGEGAFYCVAAVWCEDGYAGNLFDDEDGIVMRKTRIYLSGLVVKDVLIILFHIKKMALHIFAVVCLCRQFHANQYLTLNISDNKGKEKHFNRNSTSVYKRMYRFRTKIKMIRYICRKMDRWLYISNNMICHITAVGMYIQEMMNF